MSAPLTRSAAAKKRQVDHAEIDAKKVKTETATEVNDDLFFAEQAVQMLCDMSEHFLTEGVARATDGGAVARLHPVHDDVYEVYVQLLAKTGTIDAAPMTEDREMKAKYSAFYDVPAFTDHMRCLDNGRLWTLDLDLEGVYNEFTLHAQKRPGIYAYLTAHALEAAFADEDVKTAYKLTDDSAVRAFMQVFLLARVVCTGERQQTYRCERVVCIDWPIYESRLTREGTYETCFVVADHDVLHECASIHEQLRLDENEMLLAGAVTMIGLEQADTSNAFELMPTLYSSTTTYEADVGVAFRLHSVCRPKQRGPELPVHLGEGFGCVSIGAADSPLFASGCGFAVAHTLISALLRRLRQLSRLIVKFHNEFVMPYAALHKDRAAAQRLFDFVLDTWLPSPHAIALCHEPDGAPHFYFYPHDDSRGDELPHDVLNASFHTPLVGTATLTAEQLAPLFLAVVTQFLAAMRDSKDFFGPKQVPRIAMHVLLNGGPKSDYLPVKLHALGARSLDHMHDGDSAAHTYESLANLLRVDCDRERLAYICAQSPAPNRCESASDIALVAPLQSAVKPSWTRAALCTASKAWCIGGLKKGACCDRSIDDVRTLLDTVILDPAIDVAMSFLDAVCDRAVDAATSAQPLAPVWRSTLKTPQMGRAYGHGTSVAVVESFFRDLLLHSAFEYDTEKQLLLFAGGGGTRCENCHKHSDTLLLSRELVSYFQILEVPLADVAMKSCLFATPAGHRAILEAVLLAGVHSVRLPYRLDPVVFFDDPMERLEALHAVDAFALRRIFGDMTSAELRELDLGFDRGHRDAYERALINERDRVSAFHSVFAYDTNPAARALRLECVRMGVVQLMCDYGYVNKPVRCDRVSFDMILQLLDVTTLVHFLRRHDLTAGCVHRPDMEEATHPVSIESSVVDIMTNMMNSDAQQMPNVSREWRISEMLARWPSAPDGLSPRQEAALEMYHQAQKQYEGLCALRVLSFLCKWLEESDDKRRAAFYCSVTARESVAPYDVDRASRDPRIETRRHLFDVLTECVPHIDGNLDRMPRRPDLIRIEVYCRKLTHSLTAAEKKLLFTLPRSMPKLAVQVHSHMRLAPLSSLPHKMPEITTCANNIVFADDYVDYAQFCGDMEHVLAAARDGFQIA